MGCGLETAMSVRAEMIEQGRLSRELWVVAPANGDAWTDNVRASADLFAKLHGLAHDETGVRRDEIFVDANGDYRRIMNTDCPEFDRKFVEKLNDMGAHGRFHLYRPNIDFTPETSSKLASLRSMNRYVKFKTYEQEKPHIRKSGGNYDDFLH